MSERWLDEDEAAPVRLLLRAAGPVDERTLALSSLAGVVAPARDQAAVRGLVERCRGAGKALFVEDDVDLAWDADTDGVLLARDPGGVEEARRRLGADALIGVVCGLSRHAAMVAGERGADYVVFDPGPGGMAEAVALTAWWSDLFVLPCVVAMHGIDGVADLVAAKADFLLAPTPAILAALDTALGGMEQHK